MATGSINLFGGGGELLSVCALRRGVGGLKFIRPADVLKGHGFSRAVKLSALVMFFSFSALAQGGELRFALQSDPKSFNPLLVEDEPSFYIRYLTGGVLIRLDRATQGYDPELAKSWKVTEGGKRITFQLREGISFS